MHLEMSAQRPVNVNFSPIAASGTAPDRLICSPLVKRIWGHSTPAPKNIPLTVLSPTATGSPLSQAEAGRASCQLKMVLRIKTDLITVTSMHVVTLEKKCFLSVGRKTGRYWLSCLNHALRIFLVKPPKRPMTLNASKADQHLISRSRPFFLDFGCSSLLRPAPLSSLNPTSLLDNNPTQMPDNVPTRMTGNGAFRTFESPACIPLSTRTRSNVPTRTRSSDRCSHI